MINNFELIGKRGFFILVGVCSLSFCVGLLVHYLASSPGGGASPSTNHEERDVGQNPQSTSYEEPSHQTETEPEFIPVVPLEDVPEETQTVDKWENEQDIVQKIIDRIDANNIRENLRYLTEKPHLAASERDNELAEHIRDAFQNAGFDVAELVPYNLLLSKPDPENPNKIYLHENEMVIFESKHQEEAIHLDDPDPNFVHAFNAYTPAGEVTTAPGVGVVYVNYGRLEDFKMLEELGVNVSGHIAMVRYGKIFRGNKVRHAEENGAIGIIIFSDPEDVAAEGTSPEDVYDNSFWLPGSGMQRGGTYLGDGDPLTPGWPSTEHAYRIGIDEADLASIPAQPIGYDDARQILERLDGDVAPEEWQGGMGNITYKLGPLFNFESRDISLTLSTHNSLNVSRNYNVIGIIKGDIEPDRYVFVGNHRDAWGYGASDPSSGTAQLLESARVFGTLLAEGWRPRRSIVFCSWGAEEYGLIGSTEWVEEHVDKLMTRSVVYVNTDTCASGPIINVKGSPMLIDPTFKITKMVPGVNDDSKTLFDEWQEYQQLLDADAEELPKMSVPGSGSDYASFLFYAGIPSMDIWFRRDESKYNITTYPSYHTGYETFYMVSQFVDPEFRIIQGCGRLASVTLKYFSDSTIIPYGISRFGEAMVKGLKEFEQRDKLMEIYDKYSELENSANRFYETAKMFEMEIPKALNASDLEQRMINDQLLKLEQSFILPQGLPGRPSARHSVFAPSKFDNYASAGFPGLSDLLHDYDELGEQDQMERDKEIKRHTSDLMIMTERATSLLNELHVI